MFKEIVFIILPIIIIVGVLIFLCLRSPAAKGKRGEKEVKLFVELAQTEEQVSFNNVVLKNANGMTSQIDHVVVNPRGVFVF